MMEPQPLIGDCAPIAKMNTARINFVFATNYYWNLHKIDVKNAFLHRNLEEEIYIKVPSTYTRHIKANTFCKLRKALYRLKQ